MQSNRSFKVIVVAIGNGINVLINFLTLPYLVRSLSFDDYGTYGQVLMIITILQGFFTYNLNQIANVYFAEDTQDPKVVFSTLIRMTIGMSLLSCFAMFLSIPFIGSAFKNEALFHLLTFSTLNLFAQVIAPVLISVLIFFNRVQNTVSILVVTNILKVLAMFYAIHYLGSLNYLMLALSIVSFIQILLFFVQIPKEILSFQYFDGSLAKRIFVMASPLALSSLIEKSLVYLDGVMVSAMLTTTAYAFYRAGAVEVPFVAGLYGSVTAIVMPEIAKLFNENNLKEIIRLKRIAISGTIFFVYPVLIFLLFFAEPLVSTYLSKSYSASILIFMIFNLSLLVRVNDYQDVIIMSKNSKYIIRAVVLVALLNLLLNYSLINWIGINGAACAFIISLSVFAMILLWKTINVLNCRLRDLFDFKMIFKVVGISVFVAALIFGLNKMFFNSVWFIIACAPIYFIFILLGGFKFNLIPESLAGFLKNKIKILNSI
ncbi:MAG: oligosaccharide flippase family protein [Bacteroidota bacterium]